MLNVPLGSISVLNVGTIDQLTNHPKRLRPRVGCSTGRRTRRHQSMIDKSPDPRRSSTPADLGYLHRAVCDSSTHPNILDRRPTSHGGLRSASRLLQCPAPGHRQPRRVKLDLLDSRVDSVYFDRRSGQAPATTRNCPGSWAHKDHHRPRQQRVRCGLHAQRRREPDGDDPSSYIEAFRRCRHGTLWEHAALTEVSLRSASMPGHRSAQPRRRTRGHREP